MKNIQYLLIAAVVLLASEPLFAQEIRQSLPEGDIREYQQKVGEYALPFNGKEQSGYYLNLTNHPYWYTDELVPGDLLYNNILYKDVLMRFDLYRDEFIVRMPNKPFLIVLEYEKFGQAFLHGYTVVSSLKYQLKNAPAGKYHILLHEGEFPVIKSYGSTLDEKIVDRSIEHTFRFAEKIYVSKDNTCYQVSRKSALLKLFPDKKKELEAYIKQNKLKFNKLQKETSILRVVEYYETLMR
ncbi:hypothetical protein LJC44_01730 [Parabacteroides sp. OttesenSCG-928-G06]|nr:hypothetical protein [Parabacteroides sp. OttesenSCG-928-K15]MDL2281823.1 hypothetical protein [Parabacteroides sp. OttesenSCG-928-G06]